MNGLKIFVKKIVNGLGLDIVKLKSVVATETPYSHHSKVNDEIVDVEKLGDMSLAIPGMITPEAGKFLFSLCYMQDLKGDVIEIGSWQGRSSIFLARAVKESKNGKFYAIDHFGGNVGKEESYKVDGSLCNLKDSFNRNISKFGLDNVVNLLDMINVEAAKEVKGSVVRFLFIDGDHTREGVQKDIELFFPLLTKGSIVVFDDYFEGFPDVIDVVDELFEKSEFERIFYLRHTLVIKI